MQKMAKTTAGLACLAALAMSQSARADCEIPISLAGRSFINTLDAHYSPRNPNAGNTVHLQLAEDSYQLKVLNTSMLLTGRFRYEKLNTRTGQLSMHEVYEGSPAQYTLTLVCLTDRTGIFVFSQDQGPIKPERRQNTGRYVLLE